MEALVCLKVFNKNWLDPPMRVEGVGRRAPGGLPRPSEPRRRRGVFATPSRSSDRRLARLARLRESISHSSMINGRRSASASSSTAHRKHPVAATACHRRVATVGVESNSGNTPAAPRRAVRAWSTYRASVVVPIKYRRRSGARIRSVTWVFAQTNRNRIQRRPVSDM